MKRVFESHRASAVFHNMTTTVVNSRRGMLATIALERIVYQLDILWRQICKVLIAAFQSQIQRFQDENGFEYFAYFIRRRLDLVLAFNLLTWPEHATTFKIQLSHWFGFRCANCRPRFQVVKLEDKVGRNHGAQLVIWYKGIQRHPMWITMKREVIALFWHSELMNKSATIKNFRLLTMS